MWRAAVRSSGETVVRGSSGVRWAGGRRHAARGGQRLARAVGAGGQVGGSVCTMRLPAVCVLRWLTTVPSGPGTGSATATSSGSTRTSWSSTAAPDPRAAATRAAHSSVTERGDVLWQGGRARNPVACGSAGTMPPAWSGGLVPVRGEQGTGCAQSGGRQVADARADSHGAPPRALDDEAHTSRSGTAAPTGSSRVSASRWASGPTVSGRPQAVRQPLPNPGMRGARWCPQRWSAPRRGGGGGRAPDRAPRAPARCSGRDLSRPPGVAARTRRTVGPRSSVTRDSPPGAGREAVPVHCGAWLPVSSRNSRTLSADPGRGARPGRRNGGAWYGS